jgi:hypothetical protein
VGHLLEPARNQQVAVLDTVDLGFTQEPLSAAEPAGRARRLATKQHVVPDPEAAPDGARHVTRGEVLTMRPLERRDVLVVSPEHVRADGEQLEVGGSEVRRAVRCRQRRVRIRPGRFLVPFAAPRQIGALRHRWAEQ